MSLLSTAVLFDRPVGKALGVAVHRMAEASTSTCTWHGTKLKPVAVGETGDDDDDDDSIANCIANKSSLASLSLYMLNCVRLAGTITVPVRL